MNRKNIEEKIKIHLKKIDESKKIVAIERDKLRKHLEELESIVESFDRGIDAIEDGVRAIEEGIDAISEFN